MGKDTAVNTERIEMDLEKFYQANEPSGEFLEGLDSRLTRACAEMKNRSSKQVGRPRRRHWTAATAAATLLAAIVMIGAVGPRQVLAEVQSWLGYGPAAPDSARPPAAQTQSVVAATVAQVLAQVQNWLGYVPGYGFVEPDAARAMAEPVSQTQDGVTVTVTQVYADLNQTIVVLTIDGISATSAGDTPPENVWVTDARLILPDGSAIAPESYQGFLEGYFTFPALPQDVLQVTLAASRLYSIPEARVAGEWRLDLPLGYVAAPPGITLPDVVQPPADSPTVVLPQPTPVDIASNEVHEISLRVLDVVYTETETALRIQFEGVSAAWWAGGGPMGGILEDDLGNSYPIREGSNTALAPDGTYALTFEPVSPDARRLTWTVPSLHFFASLEDASIVVDFGDNPQPGEIFPLDQTVMAWEVPVHFLRMSIRNDVSHTPGMALNTLVFEGDIAFTQDELQVQDVQFSPEVYDALDVHAGGGSGGGGGEVPAQFRIELGIPQSTPLPTGQFEFPIAGVGLWLEGPYTVSWDITPSE